MRLCGEKIGQEQAKRSGKRCCSYDGNIPYRHVVYDM